MTSQNMNNSSRKLKCKGRGMRADTLLLVVRVMKNQNMTGHVTAGCVFVVVQQTVVKLTTPYHFIQTAR